MNNIVDNLEELLVEANKMKGWSWCQNEAMWCTWSLEKFGAISFPSLSHEDSHPRHLAVTEIPELLKPYNRSLQHQTDTASLLKSHSLPFEESRRLVNQWSALVEIEADDWASEWEELCEAEIDRWNSR